MIQSPSPIVEVNLVVLGIDSNYDKITKLAFAYRQTQVYPYLVERGFTVEYCQGQLARRYYVAEAAIDSGVVYITGSGHGFHDAFTGDSPSPIFSVGNYSEQESQGKIIHLLSCYTARALGADLVQHGCLAFFGYDEKFTIVTQKADIFFECDSEIDRAFAEGLTAEAVYQRVKALYKSRIEEYYDRYLKAEDDEEVVILKRTYSLLASSLKHLCAPSVHQRWGNPEAQLY